MSGLQCGAHGTGPHVSTHRRSRRRPAGLLTGRSSSRVGHVAMAAVQHTDRPALGRTTSTSDREPSNRPHNSGPLPRPPRRGGSRCTGCGGRGPCSARSRWSWARSRSSSRPGFARFDAAKDRPGSFGPLQGDRGRTHDDADEYDNDTTEDHDDNRCSQGAGHRCPPGTASRYNISLGDYAGEADPGGRPLSASATGTHPTYATDYLEKGATAGPGWTAAANIKAWSSSPYRMAIGVPILPGVGTLAQGATGAYNQYFAILGKNLVSDNEADAILRLGWEFNGNWFTMVRGERDGRSQLRRLLASDRDDHAGRARRRSSSSCGTPTRPAPRPTTPTRPIPGTPTWTTSGPTSTTTSGGRPFTPAA